MAFERKRAEPWRRYGSVNEDTEDDAVARRRVDEIYNVSWPAAFQVQRGQVITTNGPSGRMPG